MQLKDIVIDRAIKGEDKGAVCDDELSMEILVFTLDMELMPKYKSKEAFDL